MKRIITTIILAHWLLFFVLHALGALAGSLTLATMSGISNAISVFGSEGAIRAMPLISAGMGTASLLVATLFLWAFLTSVLVSDDSTDDGELEKIAFGGASVVFTMLTALAIMDADPEMLMSSTGYFAALLLSWLAIKMEFLEHLFISSFNKPSTDNLTESASTARAMASSAAHQNLLAKIAGRERN